MLPSDNKPLPQPIFIKNVVAVAAYSRLASRSQAKFQTMKLNPLPLCCTSAPVQSTVSTCRSLRFLPRSCADVSLNTHCPSGLSQVNSSYATEIRCKPDISRLCISRNWIYHGRTLDPIFTPQIS